MESLRKINGVEGGEDKHDTERKSKVTNAVNNKRLLCRIRRRLLFKPEPDKQVRAKPNSLPSDKHKEEVIAQNKQEHGKGEQVQVTKVTMVALVMVHVTNGVDV